MRKRCFISKVLILLLLSPLHSLGDMLLPKKMTSSQIETYLENKTKHGDVDAARLLRLVKTGKELLQIESYNVSPLYIKGKEIETFSAGDLRSQWKEAISANPGWNQILPAAAKAELLEAQNEFTAVFSKSPYELAWLKKTTGDISGARTLLKSLFEDQFASLMKMDTVYSGIGNGPLHEIELAWSALSPLCTSAERREYEAKLKKVKVRISTLPQVEIFT